MTDHPVDTDELRAEIEAAWKRNRISCDLYRALFGALGELDSLRAQVAELEKRSSAIGEVVKAARDLVDFEFDRAPVPALQDEMSPLERLLGAVDALPSPPSGEKGNG